MGASHVLARHPGPDERGPPGAQSEVAAGERAHPCQGHTERRSNAEICPGACLRGEQRGGLARL